MRQLLTLSLLLYLMSCGIGQTNNKEDLKIDLIKITTVHGEIIFKLYDETPRHKESFIKLVKEGYFENYTFNRVIDNFVAQGGCPDTAEGFADSPYLLAPEFNERLIHVYGAVGAGRDDNPEMLSAGCQFYIVQNKEGLHRLDNQYTVFGQVISDMSVVDKIVKVETDSLDEPIMPIPLKIELIQTDKKGLENLLN